MRVNLGVISVLLVCVSAASAVSIETVPVGNPGNAGELSGGGAGGSGADRICGAVGYNYRIGKYEVTAGQYCEFLNAVARTDTYGLYSSEMDYDANPAARGCNIKRTGSPGSYVYAVASDWGNRPVNYVSWGDAARYSNWLSNGRRSGVQNASTTEDGSYNLSGATSTIGLLAVTRKGDATWVIPSEDEWYKAAYHRNDGAAGHYYDYPTSSNIGPSNDLLSVDPGNNANFDDYYGDRWTIGGPYWRTESGAFGNSSSPYGTFDQGGNVWEWNEAIPSSGVRGARGGSFNYYGYGYMAANHRASAGPAYECDFIGFRVAYVPEPGSALLVLVGGLAAGVRRGR